MILEFDPYATSDLQNLIIFPNIHVIGCKKKTQFTNMFNVQCAFYMYVFYLSIKSFYKNESFLSYLH